MAKTVAKTVKLKSCNRNCMVFKPKIFTVWTFIDDIWQSLF